MRAEIQILTPYAISSEIDLLSEYDNAKLYSRPSH